MLLPVNQMTLELVVQLVSTALKLQMMILSAAILVLTVVPLLTRTKTTVLIAQLAHSVELVQQTPLVHALTALIAHSEQSSMMSMAVQQVRPPQALLVLKVTAQIAQLASYVARALVRLLSVVLLTMCAHLVATRHLFHFMILEHTVMLVNISLTQRLALPMELLVTAVWQVATALASEV